MKQVQEDDSSWVLEDNSSSGSSLRGGTTKQSIFVDLSKEIASADEKSASQ
ncbi:hypothetical protein [Pedobacter sp. N23S346]|uniref:hypothetical protein n=1 Tax=Pedobacter sp. N23S346 TaxID=3402750 RepID=UPI003AF1D50C